MRADTDREQEFEKALALRAAKAAKRRLREIEAVEELPDELSEQLCAAVPSRWGADGSPTWRRRSGGRRTRSGSDGSGGRGGSRGDVVERLRHEVLAARS